MSGRNGNDIGYRVNKGGKSERTSSTTGAASAGVAAGGGALNFPEQNRPTPGSSMFVKAKAAARSDPTRRNEPR